MQGEEECDSTPLLEHPLALLCCTAATQTLFPCWSSAALLGLQHLPDCNDLALRKVLYNSIPFGVPDATNQHIKKGSRHKIFPSPGLFFSLAFPESKLRTQKNVTSWAQFSSDSSPLRRLYRDLAHYFTQHRLPGLSPWRLSSSQATVPQTFFPGVFPFVCFFSGWILTPIYLRLGHSQALPSQTSSSPVPSPFTARQRRNKPLPAATYLPLIHAVPKRLGDHPVPSQLHLTEPTPCNPQLIRIRWEGIWSQAMLTLIVHKGPAICNR